VGQRIRKKKTKVSLANSNHDKILGLLLILFRLKHKLSQAMLASVLGMQQSAISRMECGEQSITLSHLLKLNHSYGNSDFVFVHVDARKIIGVERELIESLQAELIKVRQGVSA
jgi:transcriptional regulator with XRE-family HTH domain